MDTNEHASPKSSVVLDKDVAIGLKLTGTWSLENPRPGAVAHMSLHQKLTMSKSHPIEMADNNCSPMFTGGPVVRQILATVAIEARFGTRQRRVGGGHLGGLLDSVNAFLHFCYK